MPLYSESYYQTRKFVGYQPILTQREQDIINQSHNKLPPVPRGCSSESRRNGDKVSPSQCNERKCFGDCYVK